MITFTAGYNGKKVRKNRTLPAWSEGYLDIHTISTGRGECLFLILPDGTSIVVDYIIGIYVIVRFEQFPVLEDCIGCPVS